MARWNNVCEDNSPIYDRNDHYLPAFPYSSHLESECRVKDFKVGKLLGRGGFGRVFKGIHVPSGKLVALKIAKKRHGSIQYKLVRNEECLQKKFKFPWISKLYCSMIDGENVILVMELIQGAELLKVIQKKTFSSHSHSPSHSHSHSPSHSSIPPIPFNPHLITAQLILTLEYLHRQNIVYRDMKAENIMLDEKGNTKLVDFGLSLFKPYRTAKLSGRIGTPLFLAPEMISGKRYDEAIDWYGLGLLIYEMLTKRATFEDYKRSNLEKVIPRGFTCPDDLDELACDLIQKLAHRNPAKRLGLGNIREIKNHPWLAEINWNMLEDQIINYQEDNS